MVDHVKALGRKLTYPKLVVFGYTLLFFLYFLPIPEVSFIKQIPFENLFGASWFFIIGGAFVLEAMLAMSDMKKDAGKFTSYLVLGFGVLAVIFGGFIASEGIDVFADNEIISVFVSLVLGLASIFFFAMVYSELFHRKSFLHLVQQQA